MATVTAADQSTVNALYIALFNRAPDADGFAFWTNGLASGVPLLTIVNGFLGSPEARSIYTDTQTPEQFVATFYQTVFGRAADADGLGFWTGVLDTATKNNSETARALLVSKIIEVVITKLDTKPNDITDAQYKQTVADRDLFGKKLVVGLNYALTQQGNDLTIAKQLIANLTTPTAPSPSTPPVGNQTFTLTTNPDPVTGGPGDDTFNAPLVVNTPTLNSTDVLDGGAGTDTLNVVTFYSSTIVPTLSNIEIIKVRAQSQEGLDLSKATGVTHVRVEDSTTDVTIQNVGGAALAVAEQTKGVTFTNATATALSLELKNLASAASVTLNDAAATSYALVLDNAHATLGRTGTGAGVTAITLQASGANTLSLSATDAATVQTVTVTGSGSIDFSGGALSALTSFTAGDGGFKLTSTNSNANVLAVTTGAGIDTIVANGASIKTLDTGAGNDVVTLNTAALSAGANVNLGDGNDTITLSQGSAAGAVINGGAGDDTIITGVVRHAIPGSAKLGEVQTLTIGDPSDTSAGDDAISVTVLGRLNAVIVRDMNDKAAITDFIKLVVDSNKLAGLSVTAGPDTVTFSFVDSQAGIDIAPIVFDGNFDNNTIVLAGTVVETVKGAPATSGTTGSLDTLNGGAGSDTFVFTTPDVDSVGGAVTAVIQDFLTEVDKIKVTAAGDGAGSATNFRKAGSTVADLVTLLTDADTALTGLVKYYVGQVGNDAYLVTDANGVGYTNVIKLTGVALGGVNDTDLIA